MRALYRVGTAMSGVATGRSQDREPAFDFRSDPCVRVDPLQVFAAAGTAPRYYWEQPSAGRFRVGVGAAARLEFSGADRFRAANEAARALFDRLRWSGAGPRLGHLFAGFAFAPTGPAGETWDGFPNAELCLPELVYSLDDGRCVRDALAGSRHESLQPRAPALVPAVRGIVEICNGGPGPYRGRVEEILREIRAGRFRKVVLAREVHVAASSAIDAVAWLVALRERFPTCTLFAVGRGDAVFLGASPERLVRVEGALVETAALAGTAPRGASRSADQALGAALCDSSKNGAEHDFVVRHIESVLGECCDDVEVAGEPTLVRNRTVQHLCTAIRARRRNVAPASLLELVDRLHPTPAVGGVPGPAALEWLAAHESFDRGWFAGPVGYLRSDGDGEFAVALRSALLRGRFATAWAGAGIVARSDPTAEYTETELKLRAVLGPLLWGAP
ncbi:MAG: isochorismate synthase [Steroidobacteraceae bacterium]